MLKLIVLALVTFMLAPPTFAQAPPPPPPGDFPAPHPHDGQRPSKKPKEVTPPERSSVKPAMPVAPPTPEPTAPDEPHIK